jgi:glyoxylase-like metal-dependent hydrolase (beta-lactamase superfamily II)
LGPRLFRANCYTVQGRDADLQFDFGWGLCPYRAALPLSGASVPDYLQTMARLADRDCRLVLAGHGPALDRAAMRAIALGYIRSKD